jgi:mannose-6-phosphate isomerase class I
VFIIFIGLMKFKTSFNITPAVTVKGGDMQCFVGWEKIGIELTRALGQNDAKNRIIVIETYQGVIYEELKLNFHQLFHPDYMIDMLDLFKEESLIREMTWPDVTDDRVFGYMTRLAMLDFLDNEKLEEARQKLSQQKGSLILIVGYGASLVINDPTILVYADMARWEIQRRMRNDLIDNLGIHNRKEHPELKYKRGYFVDWRVCDRLKKQTFYSWDYVMDTNQSDNPKMITATALSEGLRQTVQQPFSVVPFFDPGPWGGQWMKEKFSLGQENDNYAWCFNCVPEENSLYLKFDEVNFELPANNLVFFQTQTLLGEAVHARFGDEFPIRFDFLDTMLGGNLSLQVHPLTEYIQDKFGMHFTQDESYYMMDVDTDGSVYLGLKDGINPEEMKLDLRIAEKEGNSFVVSKYVENWPAKKHDHFLIPAGTVHCSGSNGMVLEISATPYIFTFKLYDWGRKNLDGKPRPINVEHGLNNIQWDRTTDWTRINLINKVVRIAEGDGWIEEQTGLHEREFIETRRHWFTKKVEHNTNNGVQVLNLVEGDEIIVESPLNAFDPFVVHYAETFIVPAAIGPYTIKPFGKSDGKKCATIKAFVRT